MQIANGDNFHEMAKPVFWKKQNKKKNKKKNNLSSAELAQRVIQVNFAICLEFLFIEFKLL